MQGERDKWLAAIDTTFSRIEGMQLVTQLLEIMSYQAYVAIIAIYLLAICRQFEGLIDRQGQIAYDCWGATILAAGVYTTRYMCCLS